jgi:hypothetical protein
LEAITSSGNYLGTDRLKRALTNAERNQLERMLRKHDFVGASMVALRFAYKLTHSRGRAGDLAGRVNERLVRWGWDPNAVSLVKRLCRLVWSVYTHELEETAVARRAEEVFLAEQAAEGESLPAAPQRGDPLRDKKGAGLYTASPEQNVIRLEEEREEEARSEAQLAEMREDIAKLRAIFVAKKDHVNVLYLDRWLAGDQVTKMAADTGRDIEEFNAARKRRVRVLRRFLAEKNGVPPDDEENE